MTTSIVNQAFEVEADSIEEARKLAMDKLPVEYDQYVQVLLQDGKPKSVTFTADSFTVAHSMSDSKIPEDAIVLEKIEVQTPEKRMLTVSAKNEDAARQQAITQIKDDKFSVINITLAFLGKKGFFGYGKILNQYKVELFRHAIIEVKYKQNAKISYYNTITIGLKEWTAKNLNVERYRNGDLIPQVEDSDKWSKLTTGAWCYYDNDSKNGNRFGKLYNWYAVYDSRGLIPKGWHIPHDSEWSQLEYYLCVECNQDVIDVSSMFKIDIRFIFKDRNAGFKNSDKSDKSSVVDKFRAVLINPYPLVDFKNGFPVCNGGIRDKDGNFKHLNALGSIWSSTDKFSYIVWINFMLFHLKQDFYIKDLNNCLDGKKNGLSVRCVRD